MTTQYIAKLLATYPSIREIWLIGSRAEGSVKASSDWDYLAFGNQSILRALAKDGKSNQPDIDLLIVYDGDNFEKPWPDGDKQKRGSLTSWEWTPTSATTATYRATKARENDGFNVEVRTGRAVRVAP